MAGGWQLGVGHANAVSYGAVAGSTSGTAIPTGGSANTKGSYTQIVSATTADCNGLVVCFDPTQTSGAGVAIDIAVGGAGSEQVIIGNLTYNAAAMKQAAVTPVLPLAIPAGSRIAARAQGTSASDNAAICLIALDSSYNDWFSGGGSDTLGYVSASTQGTAVAAGSNTPGSYVQLVSATTSDYRGFMLAFDDQNDTTSSSQATFLVDIAVGGAGSEKILVAQIQTAIRNFSGGICVPVYSALYECAIPAGSRIAARAQANGGLNVLGVTMYGFH